MKKLNTSTIRASGNSYVPDESLVCIVYEIAPGIKPIALFHKSTPKTSPEREFASYTRQLRNWSAYGDLFRPLERMKLR